MEPAQILEASDRTVLSAQLDGLPRPWGFWSTSGWLVLAYILATVLTIPIAMLWIVFNNMVGGNHTSGKSPPLLFESVISVLIVALLMIIARFAGWKARDYFALVAPSKRDLLLVLGCWILLLALIGGIDCIFAETSKADENWLRQIYLEARAARALPLLWFSVVVDAPIFEEMIFRGFLFRGWSSTRLGALGAIMLTSLLFGLIHVQYTWMGALQCTLVGLAAGWLRWHSRSIFPPMLLHAINNAMVMVILTWAAA